MPLIYRPASEQDLGRAQELVVRSINDLTERHGFGPMAVLRPTQFQSFSLKDDPDGLWVAEDTGELLGFGFSWVCGGLWFLAELFVSPGHQGRGIGNELLKRTLDHAKKRGTTNRALITFTFNTVSQGLYIRHGMFPRLPIYNFKVARELLMDRLKGAQLRYVPLEDKASHLHSVAHIDERTLGVAREKHHRHLINDSGIRGVIFYAGDDCVGYAYISPDGHIGPLGVAEPEVLGAAFKAALHLAAKSGSSHVSAFLPGTSDVALSIAVDHGMRITFPMMLVSTHDFGNWAQYLPRNPGFM
jgi:ribosomal protein S18 acetylase RimI-like enzyme